MPGMRSARWSPLLERVSRTKKAAGPSAELRTVPVSKQGRVTRALVRSLGVELAGRVPPGRKAFVSELLRHVGRPDFYEVLAVHDPARAAQWKAMARVQRDFAKAEPGYDAKTRAYSESMRLTLHATVVQHVALEGVTPRLYERFLELHPTAFNENGGWFGNLHIPVTGALAIVKATPGQMWLNAGELVEGAHLRDALTVRAAELVRQARREVLAG
jgi:hypothetical protein